MFLGGREVGSYAGCRETPGNRQSNDSVCCFFAILRGVQSQFRYC